MSSRQPDVLTLYVCKCGGTGLSASFSGMSCGHFNDVTPVEYVPKELADELAREVERRDVGSRNPLGRALAKYREAVGE